MSTSKPLITSVYQKPTNNGIYLHARSECPQRYKDSTIKALIHRTYKISHTWQLFHDSILKLKQAFIYNGYSNSLFDNILSHYLATISQKTGDPTNDAKNPELQKFHNVYYQKSIFICIQNR